MCVPYFLHLCRIIQAISSIAIAKQIIEVTGSVLAGNNPSSDTASAVFETVAASSLSQTFIDFRNGSFPATFLLIPNQDDNVIQPRMLERNASNLQSGNQFSQTNRTSVAVILPERVVASAPCRLVNGSIDPVAENCARRIHFAVYTSTALFSEVRRRSDTASE